MLVSQVSLKSNMDRFIDYACGIDKDVEKGLKSNMDRFIAKVKKAPESALQVFKIQYG